MNPTSATTRIEAESMYAVAMLAPPSVPGSRETRTGTARGADEHEKDPDGRRGQCDHDPDNEAPAVDHAPSTASHSMRQGRKKTPGPRGSGARMPHRRVLHAARPWYRAGVRTTIDKAGRVVIPAA